MKNNKKKKKKNLKLPIKKKEPEEAEEAEKKEEKHQQQHQQQQEEKEEEEEEEEKNHETMNGTRSNFIIQQSIHKQKNDQLLLKDKPSAPIDNLRTFKVNAIKHDYTDYETEEILNILSSSNTTKKIDKTIKNYQIKAVTKDDLRYRTNQDGNTVIIDHKSSSSSSSLIATDIDQKQSNQVFKDINMNQSIIPLKTNEYGAYYINNKRIPYVVPSLTQQQLI